MMNEAVLLAIEEEQADKILSGEKRWEYCTVAPENIKMPFRMYLYVQDRAEIVGKCIVDEKIHGSVSWLIEQTIDEVPENNQDILSYFWGSGGGYALHIRNSYRVPIPVSREQLLTQVESFATPQDFIYISNNVAERISQWGNV